MSLRMPQITARSGRHAKHYLEALLELSPRAIALLDADGVIIAANTGFCRLADRARDELIGHEERELRDAVAEAAGEALGRYVPVRAPDGSPVGWIVEYPLAADAAAAEREHHDPLTGLLTRSALAARLRALVAEGESGALVLVTLRGFDQVNERYGRRAGDQVLISVAEELRGSVRRTDAVARLGGTQFAVLLEGADADGARTACGTLSRRLGRVRVAEDRPLRAELGFAGVAGPGAGDFEALLAEAACRPYVGDAES
jgi:diguanylate cyclase (GGDEF)-like protein